MTTVNTSFHEMVLEAILQGKFPDLGTLLEYGVMTFPIKNTLLRTVGYVTQWHTGHVTFHLALVDSDSLPAIGVEKRQCLISIEEMVYLFSFHYENYFLGGNDETR